MAIATSKRQIWCASPDWSTGSTRGHMISGAPIPAGMCKIGLHRVSPIFRDLPFRKGLKRGSLDGKMVSTDDYTRLLVEHGFLVPYFRKMFWTREQFEARAKAKGRI